MKRRLAAWAILVVGVGLVAAPEVFNMWVRAPRGAQMLDGFSSIMSAKNVPVIAGYGRDVLGGFGSAPQIVQEAAHHFSGGRVTLTYQQAADFLAHRQGLGGLAYMQQQLPTLGPPFSTLLSILNKDQPYFAGMLGLPNFALFPFFFVIPGLLITFAAARFIRRDGRPDADGKSVAARRPAMFLLVIGAMLVAAPLLPMPPGFHSIRTVGPHGAVMLADFGGPLGNGTNQPVMSPATVAQFNGYITQMDAAAKEIVPAVQEAAATYGHRTVSPSAAASFLASDPTLTLANTISTGFPQMYAAFHQMLATMTADMPDYRAVQALPSFALFPYFFYFPGAIVAALAVVLLRGRPLLVAPPVARRQPRDLAEALAFTGIGPRLAVSRAGHSSLRSGEGVHVAAGPVSGTDVTAPMAAVRAPRPRQSASWWSRRLGRRPR